MFTCKNEDCFMHGCKFNPFKNWTCWICDSWITLISY